MVGRPKTKKAKQINYSKIYYNTNNTINLMINEKIDF